MGGGWTDCSVVDVWAGKPLAPSEGAAGAAGVTVEVAAHSAVLLLLTVLDLPS